MVAIAQGALLSFRSTSSLIIAGGVSDFFYQMALITISDEKAAAYSRQALKSMPQTFLYTMGGPVAATLLGSAIGYSLKKAGLEQKTKTISSIAGSLNSAGYPDGLSNESPLAGSAIELTTSNLFFSITPTPYS